MIYQGSACLMKIKIISTKKEIKMEKPTNLYFFDPLIKLNYAQEHNNIRTEKSFFLPLI